MRNLARQLATQLSSIIVISDPNSVSSYKFNSPLFSKICFQCADMVGRAHEQHLAQQVLQWLSVCSKVQLFAYGPANAIASPSSRLIKIQNGLPF